MTREQILEERCERFRDIIRDILGKRLEVDATV